MNYNQGFHPSAADRAGLLSGLRAGGQQHGMRSTSNPAGMGNLTHFDELQYMMMQQQMQFQQQPRPFQHVQQPQHHLQNSAQAQLLALQQSQMELQLQQIKMANLALQEQMLMQHQQQAQTRTQPLPMQGQQHQQQPQQHGPSYGNLAALGPATANRRVGGRSVSAGPAVSYRSNSSAPEDENNSWRYDGGHNYRGPETSYEVRPEMGAAARHEVRRDALQSLQQARQQRSPSPAATATPGTFSPPTANLDWQAHRMQYKSGNSAPEASAVVTPPAQKNSESRDYMQSGGTARPLVQHRKNSSEVSDASIQSLSISEAESHVSPNRGPALVLSKPGDEFPEDEGNDSADDGPLSPSLTASMRTASIHDTLEAAADATADSPIPRQDKEKRRTSSGRHTVILSSSIVDLRRAAAGENGRNSPFVESDSSSSSTASSPTSDKSEVASFESTNSTTATSIPNTSPTSTNFDTKEVPQPETVLGMGRAPNVAVAVTQRRTVSASPAVYLNPSASVFAPGPSSKTYPSSLSASSANSGTNTPMRLFSAPARNGTPTNIPTILRQPKGPADEKDLPAKNFAGMIRRRAVGALRLAVANGSRASPANSPVLAGFPSNVQAQEGGLPRFFSNPTSPLANQTGFNMSDLASRAMKRRSAQGGYTAIAENPGLGMLQ